MKNPINRDETAPVPDGSYSLATVAAFTFLAPMISCQPAAPDFRNRKSARAAFWCMALIEVITAVSPVVIARSDPPRRAHTIIANGHLCV